MKLNKKIILGTTTILTIVTPLATVVSCGSSKSKEQENKDIQEVQKIINKSIYSQTIYKLIIVQNKKPDLDVLLKKLGFTGKDDKKFKNLKIKINNLNSLKSGHLLTTHINISGSSLSTSLNSNNFEIDWSNSKKKKNSSVGHWKNQTNKIAFENVKQNEKIQDKWFVGENQITKITIFQGILPTYKSSIISPFLKECTNLKTLIISNPFLKVIPSQFSGENTSIKTLDLSGCINLDTIEESAFVNNEITSLKLPKNLKIIGSYAFFPNPYGPTLEYNIDFHALHNLEKIGKSAFSGVDFNQTIIDFSGLTKLKQIGGHAFYNQNKVTKMDFSGCSSLVDLGKWIIFPWLNQLTELDFSGCSSLKVLSGWSFGIKDRPDNYGLKKLNLSGCTSLTTIAGNAFRHSRINYLDLTGCTNLKTIGVNAFHSISNNSKTIVKLSDEVKKLLNTNDKKDKIFGKNNWNKIPGLNF